jgi:protein-S-isoprenylcysteine O-methyltransferase Ste14/mono/diheme cytochrome c family protein
MRMLKASEFESRHPDLLRLLIFGIAALAYRVDRDDVVWAILHWHTGARVALARLIFAVAAALVGLAASLRTWTRAYSGSSYDLGKNANLLAAGGPYRYVRHPWLLGDALFILGIGVLLNRTGLVVVVAGMAFLDIRRINREEADLQRKLGDRFYAEICKRVPRVAPALRPRIAAAIGRPQWGAAVWSEAAHWGYCVMLIAFAITLRDGVAWVLAGASLLIWSALNIREMRRHRTATQKARGYSVALVASLLAFSGQCRLGAQDRPVPHPSTGAEIFKVRCLSCHSTGADTKIGPGLYGMMQDGRLSEEQVREIVRDGIRTMPPFGGKLKDGDLDALIQYLKTLNEPSWR